VGLKRRAASRIREERAVLAHVLHKLSPDFQVPSTALVALHKFAQGARHAVPVTERPSETEADGVEALIDGAALGLAMRIEVGVAAANAVREPHEADPRSRGPHGGGARRPGLGGPRERRG
jgi:hypothetical protein